MTLENKIRVIVFAFLLLFGIFSIFEYSYFGKELFISIFALSLILLFWIIFEAYIRIQHNIDGKFVKINNKLDKELSLLNLNMNRSFDLIGLDIDKKISARILIAEERIRDSFKFAKRDSDFQTTLIRNKLSNLVSDLKYKNKRNEK